MNIQGLVKELVRYYQRFTVMLSASVFYGICSLCLNVLQGLLNIQGPIR